MTKKNLILITRPKDTADYYEKIIASEGFQALAEPMLEIIPVDFKKPDLKTYQGLILTSANAIRFLDSCTETKDIPLYVVGKQTENAARTHGFSTLISANGTGEDLVNLIKTRLQDPKKPLLHIRGNHVARPLDILLKKERIQVDTLIVYRAKTVKSLSPSCLQFLQDGRMAAITFFSKRSAINFAQLVEKHHLQKVLHSIKALSISQPVLECVQSYDWENTYVSERPDRKGMTKLLKTVFQ